MAVDGCGLVCKYIIIAFNCIFALLGFAFLAFGLWLRFSDNSRPLFEIKELNSTAFVIGVTVMIVLGAVMLIVVTFGDLGACSEKRCALSVFSSLVALLAGAEVIIGVLAYTYHDEVAGRIAEFYTSLYGLYMATNDPAMAVAITFLNNALHCCGLTGVSILEAAQHTCPNPDGFLEKIKMPSCPSAISATFDSRAPVMLGAFLGTGALLIIVLICSLTLTKSIRAAASSPQYIILSPSTPSSNPQLALPISSYYPPPDQQPVVFTPLSEANIPAAQP